MKKNEELKDRYMDELLREEARGKAVQEKLLEAVGAAIDEEEGGRVLSASPKKSSRAPWAWAALLAVSAAGVLGYLAGEKGGRFTSTTEPLAEDFTVMRTRDLAARTQALAVLDQELRTQEEIVEEKRKVLDTIVQAGGIPYVEGSRVGSIGESEQGSSLSAERQLHEGMLEKQQLQRMKLQGLAQRGSLEIPRDGDLALNEIVKPTMREESVGRKPKPSVPGSSLADSIASTTPSAVKTEFGYEFSDVGDGDGGGGFLPPQEMPLIVGQDAAKKPYTLDEQHQLLADLERAQTIDADRVREMRDELKSMGRERNRLQPALESTNESYNPLVDQVWTASLDEPLSTFSVDVDTASYTNIRRMLNAGQRVPVDAVRVEECINYFDYNYAGPEDGRPFATQVDLATCPWAEGHLLLKVGLRGQEIPAHLRPASNLVFLIDVSGSMQNSEKLPLVVESMKVLVEELDERDRVSIVVYAGAEGVVLDPTTITADGRGALLNSLNKLRAGGSTNGGAGIKRAYEIAQENFVKKGVNRVILCTDGDFNVGTTGQDDLVQLVKSRAQKGVFLSVLGFGTGNINDAMLESITNDGNGTYYYIDSRREGRKVFLEDLTGTLVTIAKDVKLQLEFNPAKVQHYRLIGYANRKLKKEDFNNDSVDAGDIGAGHTVTALYEIVPVGSKSPVRAEVDALKYQADGEIPAVRKRPVVQSKEWLTVKLRYKLPDEDVSTKIEVPVVGVPIPWTDEGADFHLAAGVALFGMKLRDSEYVGKADWSLVTELAKKGQGNDIHGHRSEFLELVRKCGGRMKE
jgi:Ca-activated chloride channel family protein